MRTPGFALTFTLMAACSGPHSDGGAVEITESQRMALRSLEGHTGSGWLLSADEHTKATTHLEGKLEHVLSNTTPLNATLTFLSERAALFGMHAPTQEFRLTRERKDELQMTHVRLQQMVRGIRVLGAELMAHYDSTGALRVIDSTYVPDVDALDVNPALTVAQAVDSALAHARANGLVGAEAATNEPELVVAQTNIAHLGYTLEVLGDGARRIYVIDARTGDVLKTYNALQSVTGTGNSSRNVSRSIEVTQEGGRYVLKDTTRGQGVWTYTAGGAQAVPGSLVASTALTSWDTSGSGRGAAVDAHFFAAKVYDYYKDKHGRAGINNSNMKMVSTVHYGQAYPNAFWDVDHMAYGDGDGSSKPFSAALDVVGHEFTHGVTQFESGLVYEGQSGALNEAMSDIFGSIIEHNVNPNAVNNWIMGEDLELAGAIRNMKTPGADNQPDNMSRFVNTTQDDGGVHINSGIINNAAYLMTMGGNNPTSNVKVERGIGWDKMAALFYRANTQILMQSSNFAAMATAAKTAATDLNFTDNEKKIVECAFKAVGIDKSGPCQALGAEPVPSTPDAGNGGQGDGVIPGTPSPGSADDSPTAAEEEARSSAALPVLEESAGCSMGSMGSMGSAENGGSPFAFIAAMLAAATLKRRARKACAIY
jgi:bacillolysin